MVSSNKVDVVMAQPEPVAVEVDEEQEREVELPSEKWTVEEIDEYADEHSIDLTGAKTKPEKLALIAEHQPAE